MTPPSATRSSCPSRAGLAQINVRVNVPGEGPRAAGKLIRWNRVQLGELAIEIQGGHRLINFQVEGNVLRGSDADADVVAEFVHELYDAIDGRSAPVAVVGRGRSGRRPRPSDAASPSRSCRRRRADR